MKKRNIEITLLKLVFALCVVVMHMQLYYHETLRLEGGAYLFVDFFFMVQGYYLYGKIKSEKSVGKEVTTYAVDRVKRFFPCVLLQSLLFLFVLISFETERTTARLIELVTGALVEASFIGMLLPKFLLNNGNLWFLSSSIIGGCIVTGLLVWKKEKLIPILPVISALIYGFIVYKIGYVDCHMERVFGFLAIGNFRAVAGISLGLVCRYFKERNYSVEESERDKKNILVWTLAVISLAYTVIVTFFFRKTMFDLSVIIAMAVLLVCADCLGHVKQSRILMFLDQIIMPIYIFQNLCITVVRHFTINPRIILIGGLMMDIAIACFWVLLNAGIKRLRHAK